MVGTMGLLLPAEGCWRPNLGLYYLRTSGQSRTFVATLTWKQNNLDRKYFGIKFFREKRKKNNGKNTSLSFTKTRKGDEGKILATKIANIPAVSGLVADFQYAAM